MTDSELLVKKYLTLVRDTALQLEGLYLRLREVREEIGDPEFIPPNLSREINLCKSTISRWSNLAASIQLGEGSREFDEFVDETEASLIEEIELLGQRNFR